MKQWEITLTKCYHSIGLMACNFIIQPFNKQSLFPWFLVLMFVQVGLCGAGIIAGKFNVIHNVQKPDPDVLFPNSIRSFGLFGCIAECMKRTLCAAVFAEQESESEKESGEGSRKSCMCIFFSNVVPNSTLSPGGGHYAMSNFGAFEAEPPQYGNTTFVRREVIKNRVFAVYSCPNDKTFKMAYNAHQKTWPYLRPNCAERLCDVEHIWGIAVWHGLGSGTHILKPLCDVNERVNGRVQCRHAGWVGITDTSIKTLCIPTDCYRVNSDNWAFYGGEVSTTPTGHTCQRWDTKLPHNHSYNKPEMFLTDVSVTAAQNYCRNPSEDSFIWCYTVFEGVRWEKCSIDSC